jgi:protein disulfide-isomerase
MKNSIIILTVLFLMFSAIGCAQEKTKVAKDEFQFEWLVDYDQAFQIAKEQNKTVLIDFTGSDWCHWCIKLVDEVFSKAEFANYANDNLVMLKIDFPTTFKELPQEEQAKRMKLQEKYGVKGYPTIMLVNADGTVIGQTGYQEGGPVKYVEHLQKMINK